MPLPKSVYFISWWNWCRASIRLHLQTLMDANPSYSFGNVTRENVDSVGVHLIKKLQIVLLKTVPQILGMVGEASWHYTYQILRYKSEVCRDCLLSTKMYLFHSLQNDRLNQHAHAAATSASSYTDYHKSYSMVNKLSLYKMRDNILHPLYGLEEEPN